MVWFGTSFIYLFAIARPSNSRETEGWRHAAIWAVWSTDRIKALPGRVDTTSDVPARITLHAPFPGLAGAEAKSDKEVLKLDLLVWRLRQYRVPLDLVHYADPPSEEVLLRNVARIEAGLLGPAKVGHIGGFLEKVLAKKDHAARAALVWRNARYCAKPIKFIRFQNNWQAVNSPLSLRPELVDEVAKYMKLSKEVVNAAHILAAERKRMGETP